MRMAPSAFSNFLELEIALIESKTCWKDVPQKIGRDDAAGILQQMQMFILVGGSSLEDKLVARPPGLILCDWGLLLKVRHGGAVDVLTLLFVCKIGSSRPRSCRRCRQECCCFALKCVRLVQEGSTKSLSISQSLFWWPCVPGLIFGWVFVLPPWSWNVSTTGTLFFFWEFLCASVSV